MAFIFKLKIEKEKLNLSLLKDDATQTDKEWPESRDMGQRLFEAIEELLEKNHLKPEDVSDFVIDSEVPESYTSVRIAETLKRVYVFGVKNLQ